MDRFEQFISDKAAPFYAAKPLLTTESSDFHRMENPWEEISTLSFPGIRAFPWCRNRLSELANMKPEHVITASILFEENQIGLGCIY